MHLIAICLPLLDITQVPVKFWRHKIKYLTPQWKSDCCMRQKFKRLGQPRLAIKCIWMYGGWGLPLGEHPKPYPKGKTVCQTVSGFVWLKKKFEVFLLYIELKKLRMSVWPNKFLSDILSVRQSLGYTAKLGNLQWKNWSPLQIIMKVFKMF